MSKPVKKIEQAPESYSPKNKPEILNIMEESAGKIKMAKPYEVKTANGGSYIDGIPKLMWGEWKDSTYCGCIAALLNAMGIPVEYAEVMGLSGVCFQTIMRNDWDPSSEMPQNGWLCEKNVGDALGLGVYMLADEKEIWKQAVKSIDNGIPVLLVAGRYEPEWTLACGYSAKNSVVKFFGRTYFDYQKCNLTADQSINVPENEIFTENKYICFNGFPGCFPGGLTRFYDKNCDPITKIQALKASLETCVKTFQQPANETHKFGYDAYDVLISGFGLSESEYQAKCRDDQYHIGSMQDARRAAYLYLDECAGLLNGKNKTNLKEVAGLYKSMLDNLLTAVPYELTTAVFNDKPVNMNNTLNEVQRSGLVLALKTNKELERKVRVIISEILCDWEM